MKKLLSALSVLGITAMAGTSVVACGTNKKADNNGVSPIDKHKAIFTGNFQYLNGTTIVENKDFNFVVKGDNNFSQSFINVYNSITNKQVQVILSHFDENSPQGLANVFDILLTGEYDGIPVSLIFENNVFFDTSTPEINSDTINSFINWDEGKQLSDNKFHLFGEMNLFFGKDENEKNDIDYQNKCKTLGNSWGFVFDKKSGWTPTDWIEARDKNTPDNKEQVIFPKLLMTCEDK